MICHCPCEGPSAIQIDINHLVPARDRECFGRPSPRGAGIVYQNIDRAQSCRHLFDQWRSAIFIAKIATECCNLDAEIGQRLTRALEFIFITRGNSNTGTRRSQGTRNCQPNAARTSRDKADSITEFKQR